MRRFLVVGHKAVSGPVFSRKDLAGSGGRLDVLVRCVPAALLVSHGLRAGAEIVTLHLGPPAAPKAIHFASHGLQHLNPDESSTASLFEKALAVGTTGPVWQPSTPGVRVARLGLDEILDAWAGIPLVLLDEDGEDIGAAKDVPQDAVFVLGDHVGLTEAEVAALDRRGARRVRLGPVSLQADQCIVVLHNHLDRRG